MAISMPAPSDKTSSRKCGIPFGGVPLLLILILIQNNALSYLCSSDYEFVTQPSDITVKEGEPASFECTLQSRVSFASASSYWINGKTENVQRHPFVNITTRTDTVHRRVTSQLIIQRIHRESNALYKCSIILKDHPNKILSSNFGRLNVLYFLREDELICAGSTDKDFEEGEQVDIRCEASRSNPPATIQWLWPDSNSLNISLMSPVAESTLVANFTVTQSLHYEMVFCLATSNGFPGKSVNCSLGPFKVIHSPLVKVIPYEVEMPWPLVASMSFQCLASGYPEVRRYNWFCSPEKAFAQCTSHSQNLTIVVNPVEDAEVLTVICQARNVIGISQKNSFITIRYENETLIPDCKSSTPYYQETKQEQVIFFEYDNGPGEEGNLKCSTKVKSTDNITFRWSLNGHVISEEKGKYVLMENDFEGTYIIAYSIHKMTLPGLVTCDHRAPSETEPQMNLVACYSLAGTITDPNEPSVFKLLDHYNITSERPSELLSTTRMNVMTSDATDTPGTFWSLVWKGALAIVMVLGILLCTVLVALGWRKLMANGSYETQPSTHRLRTESNDIQHTGPQSELGHMDASPLYEIPNENLGIRMENKNAPFQHVQVLSRSNDWQRRGNIDSILESEESSSDGTRSGCSSSATDVRMSYVYEDTEQGVAHALHHYENRQVVESVLGKAGSKYFFAKVKENQLNCEDDESQENEDSSVCASA